VEHKKKDVFFVSQCMCDCTAQWCLECTHFILSFCIGSFCFI